MAKGDAVYVDSGGSINTNATVAVRPGSGVEWCITSLLGTAQMGMQFYSGGSMPDAEFLTGSKTYMQSTNGANLNVKIFLTNSRYLQMEAQANSQYGAFTGIQTK